MVFSTTGRVRVSFVDKGESESTNEHRDETNAELGRSRRDTPKATDLVVCSPPWFSEKSARKLKEFIQPGGVLRVSRYPLRYQSDRNYNGDGFFFAAYPNALTFICQTGTPFRCIPVLRIQYPYDTVVYRRTTLCACQVRQ